MSPGKRSAMHSFALLLFVCVALWSSRSSAGEPCQSGLHPGQRTGPYAALISTGPKRGTSHCYICESAERPTVIVFARTLSDPLAKLLQGLDKATEDHKSQELRAWATFLSSDQTALDPQVVAWARKHAIRNVPLGIFEDPDGPPSYRLSRDADVTILLNVKQKVVTNFAIRTGELTDEKIAEILKAVPKVCDNVK